MKKEKNKFPFQVVYEDNHLIVVNKESGVLVQGDQTKDKCLGDYVKQYIKEKYDKPGAVFLGTVHRLDRPVSGLVIFAKTSKALERMNKMMRDHKIYKTYWAIVKRRPSVMEGRLTHWLVKDPVKNITAAFDDEKDAKGKALKATLTFKALGKLNDHWLLEISPLTGRPHQIRVQLAAMGCPIRGDIKYGFGKLNPSKRDINLHARRLFFTHPVTKEPITLVAALPNEDFWEQYLTLEKIKDKELRNLLDNPNLK